MNIGFVILSHRDPGMLQRLVRRLNQSFDRPPVVCHHDSHQLAIDTSVFPSNVRFVRNPIRTRWGDLSLVQAFRIALRELYDWKPTDWFTLLSANDYLIKSGSAILSELRESPFDAYLDHRGIPAYEELPAAGKPDFGLATRCPVWTRSAYKRYVARSVRYPGINRRGAPCVRRLALLHPRWIGRSPFDDKFRCYAGDAWLTARGPCAPLLFSDTDLSRMLLRHYRNRLIPDESFFHTILGNTPGLNLCSDNKRYADWSGGRPNPKWLGMQDLPALLASGHHFARKFSESHDARVLDELDRLTEVGRGTTMAVY